MKKITSKFLSRILSNWWIVLICLLVIYIFIVSFVNDDNLNRFTSDFLGYFNSIVAPIGIILGLILGYPLLKKKIVEGYISKQFEIIHRNNQLVRKECLRLKEKYPQKHISKNLTKEYLIQALEDIRKLNEKAIDANQDAYKYSYLLYNSLLMFNEKIGDEIPENYFERYYCETLSAFINQHLNEVYNFSQSIGFVPNSNKIIEKPVLIKKLQRYVTDNSRYELVDIDKGLTFRQTSAKLVTFFSINNSFLGKSNGLLLKCCFLAAPTPAPFTRILINSNTYIPLIVERHNKNFFNRKNSSRLASGSIP